jgi:acyl-CoA reductase-like NAD-dependent aldehyde dehydrogenase
MALPAPEQYRSNLFIDGGWRAADTYRPIVNPSTEEVVGHMAEATVEDARDACAAARRAQPAWGALSGSERADYLRRMADEIAANAEFLAEVGMTESGFPPHIAHMQVGQAVGYFREAADIAEEDHRIATLPKDIPAGTGKTERAYGVIQRRPVGVVAGFVPFNGPLFGNSMKSSQALAMGNAVVMKPAPQNPLAVGELFRLFDRVGFPAGVVNLITSSSPEVGATITSSPDVDMVSFTGSTTVGKKVYEAGAATMKRQQLELGGKGATLIFEDADIDAAANGIAKTWKVNTGQSCSAPTRVIAHASIHDELVAKLVQLADSIVVGAPTEEGTQIGPVVCEEQRDRIEGFIESAVREGATIAAGGDRAGRDKGFFVAPTLIVDCEPTMTAVRNEIFGPVVCVLKFDTEEEAIELANDSEFGLYSYVFTEDLTRGLAVADRIVSGTVQINTVGMKEDMPRGGTKMSGIGREVGLIGIYEYTEMTSVVWV